MTRPHCQHPEACRAKGAGHCRICHFAAVAHKLHDDPEFKAAHRERMRRLHDDPEFKAAHRERMRRLNDDPEFKAAHRERARERMRRLHDDPEFKAAHRERMRRLHDDPEFKAAHRERMRRLHDDPEFKAKLMASRTDDPLKIALAAAGGLRAQVEAVMREHHVPRDIAEDAIILAQDDGLPLGEAVEAAWQFAGGAA